MKINHKKYPYIFEGDEYKTSDLEFKKSLFSPSFRFYTKFAFIVFYSNLKTKINIYNRYNWQASSVDIFKTLEKVGVKFHITGIDNLRNNDKPVVFVANHMSTMETVLLPSIIQPFIRLCYVMKKELTTYPLFGPVSKARHPIVVGRSNPREDLKIVLEEGEERLTSGVSVLIFPQRTRSSKVELKKFNTLGIKLAQRNGVKVLPISILTDAWPNGKVVKEFGKIDVNREVRISFGEPIEVNNSSSDAHTKAIEFIKNSFISWGKENYLQ